MSLLTNLLSVHAQMFIKDNYVRGPLNTGYNNYHMWIIYYFSHSTTSQLLYRRQYSEDWKFRENLDL